MGKQTNLEKKGFERRNIELVRSDYNKTEKYDVSHEDTKSDATKQNKPLGKGTGHGGHLHSRPDASKSSTMIDYSSFDTFNGGGSYDIHGRNEIGGRLRTMTYNLYGPDNSYLSEAIDTSANVAEGQVIFN
jgi:hypothetical protein